MSQSAVFIAWVIVQSCRFCECKDAAYFTRFRRTHGLLCTSDTALCAPVQWCTQAIAQGMLCYMDCCLQRRCCECLYFRSINIFAVGTRIQSGISSRSPSGVGRGPCFFFYVNVPATSFIPRKSHTSANRIQKLDYAPLTK